MKKYLWGILIILILAGIGVGVWGYFRANKIKDQAKEIEQITANTLNIEPVKQDESEIPLSTWKNLSDKALAIKTEIDKNSVVPDSLKEKASQYYSAKAQDKYKEIQYLQYLNEFQSEMDLKNNQPKSKGQIETILSKYDQLTKQVINLSIGPEFDSSRLKVEQEMAMFKSDLTNMSSRMDYTSPAVQLSSAGLDKAIDELKQELIKSLNDFVDLQNGIKDEIAKLGKASWVMPF